MKSSILIFLFSLNAYSHVYYSLSGIIRSQPLNANIVGQVSYDQLLWGQFEKTNPYYGYYRLGLRGGGSPTAGGFIEISPIAPIIIGFQKSKTFRFFTRNSFNCEEVECKGSIDRQDLLVRFAFGKENFIFVGSANWRDIKTESNSQLIALELENFAVTSGSSHYFESSAIVGYKLEDNKLSGILVNSGKISQGQQMFNSQYLFYRQPWNDFNVTFALGYFDSDYKRMSGISGLISINRSWGESLSLL